MVTNENNVFEIVNEAYYQLVRHRDIIGMPRMEALPEMQGQGFEELLAEVRRSGKPFFGRDLKA